MKLEYFGHTFWRVETNEVNIVFDPYSDIGYPMPSNLTADYVFISHEHHDHNNSSLIKGHPQIIRTAGKHQFPAFTAEQFAVYHDDVHGSKRGVNLITKLSLEGITLVHCGDLGHVPDQDILQQLDKPDLLLVPVGEVYTLSLSDVRRLISLIQPRLIIPMHFKTPQVSFPLGSLETFTRLQDKVTRVGSRSLEITPDLLKTSQTLVFDWPGKE